MKKGWVRRRLSEVTKKIGSGATPQGGEANYKQSGISLIRSLNVHDCEFRLKDLAFIDETQARQLDNVSVEPGDVLLNITGASVARCCIVPNDLLPARVNQHVSILRPIAHQLSPHFLQYLLVSGDYKNRLLNAGDGGATRQALTKAQLQDFEIELPPLPEQRRIVGILDEAFAGLATAEANAARNLQNAREIFDSHLHAVFSQRGAARPPVPLRQCVEDIATGPFGSLLHKSDYEAGGIPLVNPINIEGEAIVPDDRKAVGRETAERLSRYVLKENDIVIGRRGEIGRCAVITSIEAGWICGTGCFVIRPTPDTNPHYLAHLLRSKPYREQLEAVSKRATMPSISNEDLANLDVQIPPLPQQKMILRLLNLVSAKTQRLATLQQRKISALGELKKSLLHQAFAGGL